MTSRPTGPTRTRDEGGFALILSLLALMLLTFLGIALSTTTSTELQIASNQHWSQAARYNAEAGIEAGKSLLRNMDWGTILPAVRASWTPTSVTLGAAPTAAYARADKWGKTTRNFENGAVSSGTTCDAAGNGAGYGVVLDDGGGSAPYQNANLLLDQTLKGSVTLWVRRAQLWNDNGTVQDDSSNDTLILTSEGSAPGFQADSSFASRRAVAVVEITLTRSINKVCGNRTGQTGGGPEGSGFSACDPVTGNSLAGVLGAAATDTGVQ